MKEYIIKFDTDEPLSEIASGTTVRAVMDDDWTPFRKYCKKYGIPVPKNRKIMMAGCYKAVQGCTDIPEEVKRVAFKKCLELGFSPWINPEHTGDPEWLN